MNPTTTPEGAASRPQAATRFPFDAVYKALFGSTRTVADLMRGYAAAPGGPLASDALDALDLDTLQRLPAEWVTEEFRVRHADQIWQVDFKPEARERGYPCRLFLDLEFQSGIDRDMALRFHEYGAALYRELRDGPALAEDGYCALLCIVLYNGAGRWTAPTSAADLLRTPDIFGRAWVPAGLAAFHPWGYWPLDFGARAGERPIPRNVVSLIIGFEVARQRQGAPGTPDLAALVWATAQIDDEQLRAKMRLWLMRLRSHYNLNLPGMEELDVTLIEEVTELTSWLEEWIAGMHSNAIAEGKARGVAQGVAQGLEQGVEQGIERERDLLRWQAERRFGTETAARVGALLEDVAGWDLLRSVGGLIVDAETDLELTDAVATLVRSPR